MTDVRTANLSQRWMRAYGFALLAAALFVTTAWAIFILRPASVGVHLLPATVYTCGAVLSFTLMVRAGGAFAAITCYVLGTGAYFGFGVLAGGIAPDPRTLAYGSTTVLLEDLARINVLNATSVVIVLAAAAPFAYRLPADCVRLSAAPIDPRLLRLFPWISGLAAFAVVCQFIYFPLAEDLLLRTVLGNLYLVIPLCLLLLGILWDRLSPSSRLMGGFVLVGALCISIVSTSKLSLMSTLTAPTLGIWARRRSIQTITASLGVLCAVYFGIGPLVERGRAHEQYDALRNSLSTRVYLVVESLTTTPPEPPDDGSVAPDDIILPSVIRRFSLNPVQAFLMDQYDAQQVGNSLDQAWMAAIPRAFWPGKPIITRFGTELHEKYWGTMDASSALAPTYTAEAYWNYGPLGVLVVSVLLGVELGWLTRRWHFAVRGRDLAFYVVAFPTALLAAYVESWIAANYVGGFLTIFVMWGALRLTLSRLMRTHPITPHRRPTALSALGAGASR